MWYPANDDFCTGESPLHDSFKMSDYVGQTDTTATSAQDSIPSWETARSHTSWRRTPPYLVVQKCNASKGRSQDDLDTATHLLTLLATRVREDQIRAIRVSLAENTYHNALKVEVAVDRLIDDIEGRPWRF